MLIWWITLHHGSDVCYTHSKQYKIMEDGMSTRRNFLKGAGAGLVFCGCGIPMAAHAQNAPARLPVMVKGKRVKTIDTHAHCVFQQAIDLAGEKLDVVQPPVRGVPQLFLAVEQ